MAVDPSHRSWAIVALCFATIGPSSANAQHLYWSDTDGISRAKADGTEARTVVPDVYASDLALDTRRGHVYWSTPGCAGWCEFTPGTIHRANLDGAMVKVLVYDWSFGVDGFTIDPAARKLYWGGANLGDMVYAATLSSASLDGEGVQVLLRQPDVHWPNAIAVDSVSQTLYWAEVNGSIQRAPVPVPCEHTTFAPAVEDYRNDLIVDRRTRCLYWSEGNRIIRAPLDGSGMEIALITDPTVARRIALDQLSGELYWTVSGHNGFDSVWRASEDGTMIEHVLNARYIWALAIDPRTLGDVNADRLVDLYDHKHICACLIGPEQTPPEPPCSFFDVDPTDGDVDLADYATFQNAVTGAR